MAERVKYYSDGGGALIEAEVGRIKIRPRIMYRR